jgi:hypothetical protein
MNITAFHLEELAVIALFVDGKKRKLIRVNANEFTKHGNNGRWKANKLLYLNE